MKLKRPEKYILYRVVLFIFTLSLCSLTADDKAHTLLSKYCYNCHDEDLQKGNFQMDNLSQDIASGNDADLWHLVLDQLNLHEMPPKKKKQPSDVDRQYVINYITDSLRKAAEHKRQDVQVTMRRLTKQQYTNSLRDLLDLDINFGKPLPSERISEDGFKNNGEEQVISLLQTEYYQSIAKAALDKALLAKPPVSYKYSFQFGKQINKTNSSKTKKKKGAKGQSVSEKDYITKTYVNKNPTDQQSSYVENDFDKTSYANTRGSNKKRLKMLKEGILLLPSAPHKETYEAHAAFLSPSPNLQLQIKNYPSSGNFILRVKVAKAENDSEDAYVRAFIGERLDWGTDSKMVEHPVKVTGTKKNFQTVEFRGRLENFPVPVIDPRHVDPNSAMVVGVINNSGEKSDTAIIIKEIELITEPAEFWPPRSHSQVFIASKNSGNEETYSREILTQFMGKAFRRPVSRAEVNEYHALWKSIRPHCDTFVESIKDSLSAVLASPKFLYLVERKQSSSSISEMELASRLAYFLWNSTPDTQLLKLAHENKLRANLDSQLARMLQDSRSQGFVQAFTSEWLHMDRMTAVKINAKKYPNFNRYVREDMVRETHYFFNEVLNNNLSIMNFIDSDFTMLNQNLAEYYGIKGVKGAYFRRVNVAKVPERRGLISNGLFLSGNSDGEQGNPIKRGVWLISRILDDPPPEPPPNVPEIDPGDPDFAKLTVRQQLEKHRQNQSCFECHQKIDPWGLLFENYDAGGMWKGEQQKAVTLANGKKLNDAMDMKSYILQEKKQQFAQAMTKYLLRYSLGRTLSFVDQPVIDEIVKQSAKNGYKFRSLIASIVQNPLFSKK